MTAQRNRSLPEFICVLIYSAFLCAVASPSARAQSTGAIPDEELRQLVLHGGTWRDLLTGVTSPIRIEASFATFDGAGAPDGTGSVELLYDANHNERRTVTYRGQTQMMIRSGSQIASVSMDAPQGYAESLLLRALEGPFDSEALIAKEKMSFLPFTLSGIAMNCASAGEDTAIARSANLYCFAPDGRALRAWQNPYKYLALYDDLAVAGGIKIGKTIYLRQGKILRGKLQVASMGPWVPDSKSLDISGLSSDAGPIFVHDTKDKPTGGASINRPQPHYPRFEVAAKNDGVVVIFGRIDRTGRTKELEVVDSPSPNFTNEALDAVNRWTYEPLLIGKTAISRPALIVVNFNTQRTQELGPCLPGFQTGAPCKAVR